MNGQLATRMRAWWLEFDCDGVPYTWNGLAVNERAAEDLARHDLAARIAAFGETQARLVACLER